MIERKKQGGVYDRVSTQRAFGQGLRGGLFGTQHPRTGALESAYEEALVIEFRQLSIGLARQRVFPLYYKGELAGAYIADLVVENTIILELKSVRELSNAFDAQIVNYLRLSKLPVGYLVNFYNKRVIWKRFVNL